MEETVALEDDVFGASVEQLLRASPQEVARQMGVSVSEARRVRRVVLERCAAEAVSCGEILREEVRRETAEGRGVTCPVRSGWQRGNLTIPMRGHVLSLSAKMHTHLLQRRCSATRRALCTLSMRRTALIMPLLPFMPQSPALAR